MAGDVDQTGASLLPLNHDSCHPDVVALREQRVTGDWHEVHLQSRVHHEYSASPAGGLHSPLDGSLCISMQMERAQPRHSSLLARVGGAFVYDLHIEDKKAHGWLLPHIGSAHGGPEHTQLRRRIQRAAILCWRLTKRIKKPAKRIKGTPK